MTPLNALSREKTPSFSVDDSFQVPINAYF